MSLSTEDGGTGDVPLVFLSVVFRDGHTQFASSDDNRNNSNNHSPRTSFKAMTQHDRPRAPYLSATYDSSIPWPATCRNNVCGSENLLFARRRYSMPTWSALVSIVKPRASSLDRADEGHYCGRNTQLSSRLSSVAIRTRKIRMRSSRIPRTS